MPDDIEKLESEAINSALSKNWQKAIELNKQLVNYDDQNVSAYNRLAKAYLEIEKYEEAKKVLKKVLKLDPINQTARKNYEYAAARKKVLGNQPHPDIKSFIKEPGTTKEFTFAILTKGMTSKKFYLGEELKVQVSGHKVSVHKVSGELIGIFDTLTADKILNCLKRGGNVKAYFLSGEEKEATTLLKSSLPIFKSEKQEIKPFIKRDNIEEPELEVTSSEADES
ncbi:tetratricopeptide repeat protein [candidate division WWE3 bacterium]|nr:tetratricopeptide repeat protein [candidate division WWE3 bacterium]